MGLQSVVTVGSNYLYPIDSSKQSINSELINTFSKKLFLNLTKTQSFSEVEYLRLNVTRCIIKSMQCM